MPLTHHGLDVKRSTVRLHAADTFGKMLDIIRLFLVAMPVGVALFILSDQGTFYRSQPWILGCLTVAMTFVGWVLAHMGRIHFLVPLAIVCAVLVTVVGYKSSSSGVVVDRMFLVYIVSLTAAFAAPGYLVAHVKLRMHRSIIKKRRAASECLSCGYPLVNYRQDRCPECGQIRSSE